MRTRDLLSGGRGLLLATGMAAGIAALIALAVPGTAGAATCKHDNAKNEPPCNAALPDSPWGTSHRGSYAQASSPYPGLRNGKVETSHVYTPGIPIQIEFSDRYRNGKRVAWTSVIASNDSQGIVKMDARSGKLIDTYLPAEREKYPPPMTVGNISGAYNMLDRDNHFIVPRHRQIDVFGDAKKNKPGSKIKLVKRYYLPDSAFCRPDDEIVGATMTYDGYIAFVSEQGMVSTLPRKPGQMKASRLTSVSGNGKACKDPSVPVEDLETVSNSIAADERGGIYVVTSERMRKFKHGGKGKLKSAWKAPYNPGSEQSEIRLGAGSGSTPSLMGTGKQDKFVVITDGQDLMHVDLFWRNGIPKDWKGLGGNKPRRMACETPVTFGDPDATASLSEQSVTVRGYGTMHVQNLLDYDFGDIPPGPLLNALAALRGGDPAAAPRGAERIDWNPRKQKCVSRWANPNVSIPNGIPSMSSATKLGYGIAQKRGEWGVVGLDWKTGKKKFFARAQEQACGPEAFDILEEGGVGAFFGPTLEELPNSCNNSTYAATQVGPGGSMWTGTFLGVTIYRPKK